MNVNVYPDDCANSKTTDFQGMYLSVIICDEKKVTPRIKIESQEWEYLDQESKYIVPKGRSNIAIVNIPMCRKSECEAARAQWRKVQRFNLGLREELDRRQTEAFNPHLDTLIILEERIIQTKDEKIKQRIEIRIKEVQDEIIRINQRFNNERVELYAREGQLVEMFDGIQTTKTALKFLNEGKPEHPLISLEGAANDPEFHNLSALEQERTLSLLCQLYSHKNDSAKQEKYSRMLKQIRKGDPITQSSEKGLTTTSPKEWRKSINDSTAKVPFPFIEKSSNAVLLFTHKNKDRALYVKQGKKLSFWLKGSPDFHRGKIEGLSSNAIKIDGEIYSLDELAKVRGRRFGNPGGKIVGGFLMSGAVALAGYGVHLSRLSSIGPLFVIIPFSMGMAIGSLGTLAFLINEKELDLITTWDIDVVERIARGEKIGNPNGD